MNNTTREWWDSKNGRWQSATTEQQEVSVNRPAGNQVWVNEIMKNNKYREIPDDCVIPAAAAMWPMAEWSNPFSKSGFN